MTARSEGAAEGDRVLVPREQVEAWRTIAAAVSAAPASPADGGGGEEEAVRKACCPYQKRACDSVCDTCPGNAVAERVLAALASRPAVEGKLVEALRRARPYVADLPIVGDADLAFIDAALKAHGGGE